MKQSSGFKELLIWYKAVDSKNCSYDTKQWIQRTAHMIQSSGFKELLIWYKILRKTLRVSSLVLFVCKISNKLPCKQFHGKNVATKIIKNWSWNQKVARLYFSW